MPTYSVSGNNLQVSFATVPEPHHFAIAISLLLIVIAARRRSARA
ncbi:MAG: hypothetical protein ACREKL_10610 [Chthoniobacterales bacterium]